VRTLEHFRKYLYGQKFHLSIDHFALTWLMILKSLRDKPPAGFSVYKSATSLLSTVKAESNTMPRGAYPLRQSRGAGRYQAGTRYCGCSHSRLGSSRSGNRTERPGHRAHSGGSGDWTAPRIERHRWPHHHVQKLLGPMEITHCEEGHIRASIGIRRRTIINSQVNSSSKQIGRADLTTWWTVRSLECQQGPE
jgi:hypothetical protein